jgi:hypothetical protein
MGHVYSSSDWHGNLTLAKKILNEVLQPNDKLYFLGDCGDRGLSGIPVFDMLTSDPRVTFIKGNHEIFMEQGIKRWRKGASTALDFLWAQNGGAQTAQAIENSTDDKNVERLAILHNMPITVEYQNKKGQRIFLDHCGFSPFIVKNGPEKGKVRPDDRQWEPMWDRYHFQTPWPDDPAYKDIYIVHGHTPVVYLPYHYLADGIINDIPRKREDFKYEPIYYADGHKIDIDLGSWVTNKTTLLDLETLRAAIISTDD